MNESKENKTMENETILKESIAPWSNIPKAKTVSLTDIIEEQMLNKTEIKEEKEIKTVETNKFKFLLNRK